MRPVTASVTIDADREYLFDLIVDLAKRPAFCDDFQHQFRLERLDAVGVGAGARMRLEAPGLPMWMETVIVEADRPHIVKEEGMGGRLDRIPVFTVWELTAGAGTATEVSVTFWTEPSNRADKAREGMRASRWYRKHWRKALQRLQRLAEAGGPVESVQVAGGDRTPEMTHRGHLDMAGEH